MKHDHATAGQITDVPGIKVGHWTDLDAATGCTVVLCPPEGAVGGVDVRGGAPGTHEIELLRPGMLAERAHAVVLCGGSAFGLEAAAGVMRFLEEQGTGFAFGGSRIALVPAACVFDLAIGRADVRPTAEAGYRAATAAEGGPVEQGSVGAGTGCTVAKTGGMERALKGGLGTACERGPEGLLAAAIAAVNCGGDVIDAGHARTVAGPRADEPGRMLDALDLIRRGATRGPLPGENTTLAVVATNAALTKEQANRLASIAHDGIARAVRPAHGSFEGDTVFALATGELPVERRGYLALEALVPRAVERAIVRGVLCATGLAGVPSAQEWAAQAMG